MEHCIFAPGLFHINLTHVMGFCFVTQFRGQRSYAELFAARYTVRQATPVQARPPLISPDPNEPHNRRSWQFPGRNGRESRRGNRREKPAIPARISPSCDTAAASPPSCSSSVGVKPATTTPACPPRAPRHPACEPNGMNLGRKLHVLQKDRQECSIKSSS